MNDVFKELKGRTRKLEEMLTERGLGNLEFAQAVSRLRRALRRGDRTREPTPELRELLERAEGIARRSA